MTKREFFENELKMKPSEIGTAVPFNPNGETEVTEEWLISFIKNLLAERKKWHTGTPIEEGWYLYETLTGSYATFRADKEEDLKQFLYAKRWQKIEPYKEKEDGHTD